MANTADTDTLSPQQVTNLAQACARTYARGRGLRPQNAELEDMASEATIAGLRAARRWRPDGGATLLGFVWRRMHGALLDDYRQRAHDVAMLRATSIDGLPVDGEDGRLHPDPGVEEERYAVVDDREQIERLLGALPDREREVVIRYYWWGETLDAIGKELGVTEVRAGQLRRRAEQRMRTAAERNAA